MSKAKAQKTAPKEKAPQKPKTSEGMALEKTDGRKPTITRKIDEQTLEEMAKLMSKRITETGACLMLGLVPENWFNWKCKHKDKFNDVFTRIREAKLNACIDAIDEAGDGNPEKGVRADWRAKAFLVQQVIAPERFAKQADTGQTPAVSITCTLAPELVRAVFQDCQTVDVETLPDKPKAALLKAASGEADSSQPA